MFDFGEIVVRAAGHGDAAAWDAALQDIHGGNPYAVFAWREVLQSRFGLQPLYLFAQTVAEETAGYLACYVNRDGIGRKWLYSLRYGLAAKNPRSMAALLAAARQLAARHDCTAIDLLSADPIDSDTGDAYRRATFWIPLDPDRDRLWASLRDKTRNMIRRAERDGITVTEEVPDAAAAAMLDRHGCLNLLPKGVASPDAAYFESLFSALGGRVTVLAARLEGRAVGSMLLIRDGDLAAYPVQNVEPRYQRLAATQLLNWHAMLVAAGRGCTQLDMGDSSEGSPVYRSKQNFGGKPISLYGLRDNMMPHRTPSLLQRIRGRADVSIMTHAPIWLRDQYARRRVAVGRVA